MKKRFLLSVSKPHNPLPDIISDMRILILNWKDTGHPLAGGAEYATHQYAKNLVSFGHQVTLFTSRPRGVKPEETLDGIEIIRHGSIYTVQIYAFIYYLASLQYKVDIVVDQIHGLPFFTPLYVRKPILAWIHEVAGNIWEREFSFPLSAVGRILESFYFYFYANTHFLTDCNSTKTELLQRQVNAENIIIIPLTIGRQRRHTIAKTGYPSLLYIGRISPMKRLEILLEATSRLLPIYPRLKMVIAGQGKKAYLKKLKKITKSLNLTRVVKFRGKVNEREKYALFAKSWLNVQTSLKEGFGLTIMEAATRQTPTVAFNVGGLRDLLQNHKTGVLINDETAPALVLAIFNLINNRHYLKKLSRQAYQWSQTFPSWYKQAHKLEKLLLSLAG